VTRRYVNLRVVVAIDIREGVTLTDSIIREEAIEFVADALLKSRNQQRGVPLAEIAHAVARAAELEPLATEGGAA
jgi:hypothetical protein